MKKIILLGIGGHARAVVDSIEQLKIYEIVGFLDRPEHQMDSYRGYRVLGTDDDLEALREEVEYAFPAVGYLGRSNIRDVLFEKLKKLHFTIPNIIDKTATLAEDVAISDNSGVYIGKKAVINANAVIGKMTIINTNALVEHDCVVGDFSHVAINAVMCGGSSIGTHTLLGASTTVLQEVSVGNDVIIGAGNVITHFVPDNTRIYSSFESGKKTFIIAEAGVNHNGDIEIAKLLIKAAAEAGADAVKFQSFHAKSLSTPMAPKAEYQKENTSVEENQLEMLKKLELSYEEHLELSRYCQEQGICFLSTPFDEESLSVLESIGLPLYKISSGEITNYPLLVKIAELRKPVILSTGMSTLTEVADAVSVLQEHGAGSITLLHCTTQYPTSFEDVNLNAMLTLKRRFGLNVGYSDHTQGIEIPLAAVAMGATVIEKHFTLDRRMEGPDHKASIEPNELKSMVRAIRHIEAAKGNGEKKPAAAEVNNIVVVRKSIVAKRPIKTGEVFSESNITTKRPGIGISPMKWTDLIGRVATRDYNEDELIEI